MNLASATQVVASFPSKASRTHVSATNISSATNVSSARTNIASNSSPISTPSNPVLTLSSNMSNATNVSASNAFSAQNSVTSAASVANVTSAVKTSPQSQTTKTHAANFIEAGGSPLKSVVAIESTTPSAISFSPTSSDTQASPQFSLKQGAMSVQGLLGQSTNGSLGGEASGSKVIAEPSSQENTQEVKPSVAERFTTIFGDDKAAQEKVESSASQDPAQPFQDKQVNQSEPDAAKVQNQKQQDQKAQRREGLAEQAQASEQQAAQIEAAQIAQLNKRDAEVKSHEQAHSSVGGSHAQSPSFSYEKGPDGRRYAVDGEVQIDVSVVNGDAQATLNKMMKVYSAAMAPVQPSMADIRVAADALQKMNAAREELAIEHQQGVIELEDADHIIGLGRQLQQSEQDETPSQLEPFKKSTPVTHASLAYGRQSGGELTSNAVDLANKVNDTGLNGTDLNGTDLNGTGFNNTVRSFAAEQSRVDFYV
jgi:hypothetical protein